MSQAATKRRTVRVLISGRVQGVWFRGWTQQAARALGLDGWVRNRRDGAVEAVFSGNSAAVEEMLRRVREGPPGARVDAVQMVQEGGAVPAGFQLKPTV